MHFYTYEEYMSNNYYYIDDREITRGRTYVHTLDTFDSYLLVRSTWSDPKFNSTYRGRNQSIDITYPKIDCDVGVLYEFDIKDKDRYEAYVKRDSGSYYSTIQKYFPLGAGCVQPLGGAYGRVSYHPYIEVSEEVSKDSLFLPNIEGYVGQKFEPLHINLTRRSIKLNSNNLYSASGTEVANMKRLLIFQSIYSGSVTFERMDSNLLFYFITSPTANPAWDAYDSKINTTLYSSNSTMLAASMITFNYDVTPNEIYIENISEFVLGHVDMSNRYNWNVLWKTFEHKNGLPMADSIMHYTKGDNTL